MDSNNLCAKEKLKPWLVGLIVLFIIVIGWILLGRGGKDKSKFWKDRMFVGKTNLPTGTKPGGKTNQTTPPNIPQDSYHNIVEVIKPAVVGISLPRAQPFLQKWGTVGPEVPDVAWLNCPRCGLVVLNPPDIPNAPILCPKCGTKLGQNPQAQQQAWFQPTLAIGGSPQKQVTREEYLLCPNCHVRINQQPGIPWSNAKCPNCGTTMAHMIHKVESLGITRPNPATGGALGQTQAWGIGRGGFGANVLTIPCPNCGTKVTRQPGIPWVSITCPNCGSSMFCPRIPNNLQGAQRQVWIQPTAQQNPLKNIQNAPVPFTSQGTAMPGFQGLGSGIIISKRGYILTNSHLVSGQGVVNVTLFTAQGQKSFTGQIIAQASDRDLAIVKIDPKNIDLPIAPIGNSDTVQVGDTVLAFGNPFGLSQTVTSGIVSAVRGSVVIEGHKLTNLIQTDAPINQGNSGGPLVNLRGEVIGINTAIYSPVQTHTGLGFAVPINQTKEVFASYIDGFARKVTMQFIGYPNPKAYQVAGQGTRPNMGAQEGAPAWLGINIQILNDVLAEQLKVPVDRGILINEVYANSPAAEAGLERGDVIIRFDGRRITDETQIRTLLAEKKRGDKIRLTILRGRKRLNIKFETAGGEWGQAQQAAIQKKTINLLKNSEIETGSAEIISLGLAAITITPEIAFMYGLPKDTKGIVASETEGLALKCGIKDGDVIKKVNNKSTPDLISFLKVVKKGDLSRGISFLLIRKGQPIEIVIKEQPQLLPRGL